MEKLLGTVAQIGDTKVRNDDDFTDRLSHRYTTFILVIFAIVVSTKQYVGEPINCWCPAHFTDNHEDYTNKVCWVSNTYFLPFVTKHIPEEEEPRKMIGYYQWVPLILLMQVCNCGAGRCVFYAYRIKRSQISPYIRQIFHQLPQWFGIHICTFSHTVVSEDSWSWKKMYQFCTLMFSVQLQLWCTFKV